MADIHGLQVGDPVVRVMNGFRDELWENDGHVTAVSETQITCMIYVDVPRGMRFDRSTGIHVDGQELGWIRIPSPDSGVG